MALIVILSVFDGLEDFVVSRFNAFDPDMKISAKEGKSININSKEIKQIKSLSYIDASTEVIEENVLVKYQDIYHPFKIKGVESNYQRLTGIDSMIIDGKFMLYYDSVPVCNIGAGVASFLSVSLYSLNPLQIYIPKHDVKNIYTNPENAFKVKSIIPISVFSIDQDVDEYIIAHIDFVRDLMDYKQKATALEIKLKEGIKVQDAQKEIQNILGSAYVVKNRFQQKEYIYKIMKSEKLIVYFILTFILIIATFNLVGSLTMLILDKKKDINILRSMGANIKTIKQIFWFEGWLISIIGAFAGLILGAILCWAQIEFEIIKLQGDASRLFITAYPVKMSVLNFIYVLITVLTIGALFSWIPVRFITKNFFNNSDIS